MPHHTNNACVWCKIHKNDHWKMDLDFDYYHSSDLKRTLKEMNELAQKKIQKKNTVVNTNL